MGGGAHSREKTHPYKYFEHPILTPGFVLGNIEYKEIQICIWPKSDLFLKLCIRFE